ncbi:DUF2795 domain-containing protein [Streptomyces sp. XM4193]|uniref:DUF2795 domain-containing protein n=1 Tax=Streptomyces sp. XM4193 TaxID=2929782 RepID=UPI001FF9F594|nr:DUF2795 domain-containing protein [Streptomyces sp. XM4193]MCK1797440.1 DUF2795 domain-containing protein [Streptomyces sp. XM4193]
MQRQSDKHSALRDDELKQEVEGRMRSGHPTRADEALDAEPPADDDPVLAEDPVHGAGSDRISTDPGTDLRLELARHLPPDGFPAEQSELVDRLRGAEAPERLLARARELPEGRSYTDVQDVVTTLERQWDG